MKTTWYMMASLAVAVLFLGACSSDSNVNAPSDGAPVYRHGNVIPNEYIVVFRASTFDGKGEGAQSSNPEYREALIRNHMLELGSKLGIPEGNLHEALAIVDGVTITLTSDQVVKLSKEPSVEFIEQDRLIALPPVRFNADRKSNTTQSSQTTPWGVTKVGGSVDASDSDVLAWIVDTGIDLDHADLNVNTSLDKSFVSNSKSTDDGNGHGTHVAGTVGAKNNSVGVVGVAAGIQLVPIRVLDNNGSGYFSWSISGFNYIGKKGSSGDVVNYSVGPGSRYTSSTLDKAVRNLADDGFKVCLAAGNNADDCSYYSPARLNRTNVYTIAAMNSSNVFASWSNYGGPVDWIEPGVNVYSTYKGGTYATASGTSMATPHATGILAVGGIESGGTVTSVPTGTTTSWGQRD